MKKHVIQFEIEVEDDETLTQIKKNLKALMDMLDYEAKDLKIDPPPKIVLPQPNPYEDIKKPDPYPWKPIWNDPKPDVWMSTKAGH